MTTPTHKKKWGERKKIGFKAGLQIPGHLGVEFQTVFKSNFRGWKSRILQQK
jgi:hypothetical protein